MTFTALLDANVLVPYSLCDTLLRAAGAGLYRPLWSAKILDEVRGAVRRVRPDLDPSHLESRIRAMNGAFEGALVEGWEPLVDGIELGADPNDRHVVAAAVRGGASAVVTSNVRDFPDSAMTRLGLHTVSPDEFLLDLDDLDPGTMQRVIAQQAADTGNPPMTPGEVLDTLSRAGAPGFATVMSPRFA